MLIVSIGIIKLINGRDLGPFSDVFIDTSALSTGIVFPLIKRLVSPNGAPPVNVHALAYYNPETDDAIVPEYSDRVSFPHGFAPRFRLDVESETTKLWLPQLAGGADPALDLIFTAVTPDDVCPILPFPSSHPRNADRLAERFARQFAEGNWNVDERSLLYASDSNPLDLYRMLQRVYQRRNEVFAGVGGSTLILSPTGSKILSLGALMAAIAMDLPVAYVEAVQYAVGTGVTPLDSGFPVHIWLRRSNV